MERIHHVTLQVAARLFLDNSGRHLLLEEIIPLPQAIARGLAPILLYGITNATTRMKSLRFVAASEPRALLAAIEEQWREDTWLRGLPDVVVLHPGMHASAQPFVRALSEQGIQVIDSHDCVRAYEANRRSLQDHTSSLTTWRIDDATDDDRSLGRTLEQLNKASQNYFGFVHSDVFDANLGKRRPPVHAWRALPFREPSRSAPAIQIDWTYGPWCELGFRVALPVSPDQRMSAVPNAPRYLTLEPESDKEPDLDAYQLEDILASWPESLTRVAAAIGSTVKDIKGFLRGRPTLTDNAAANLREYLGFEWDDDTDDSYEAVGPYLFTPKNLSAARKSYEQATGGGDVSYATEVIPRRAMPDRRWHLILFSRYFGDPCFMLLPREGQSLSKRSCDNLINLASAPLEIAKSVYERWLSALSDAIASPELRQAIIEQIVQDDRALFDEIESNIGPD